jgi:hypothetical protein
VAKLDWLKAALPKVATERVRDLNEDAHVAVRALLGAAFENAERPHTFFDGPALWATEPDSARYRLASDQQTG